MSLFGKDLLGEMDAPKGVKIPRGIHTQIKLKDIEIGENYIDIYFENQTGQTINRRLWIPELAKTKAWDKMSVQETYETQIKNASYHLIDLVKNLVSEEVAGNLSAPDLKGLAIAAKTAVMPVKNTNLLNLKVITTEDGKYPEISKYVGYLERYVPGQEPTLTFKPSELKKMNQIQTDSDSAPDTSKYI